MGCSLGPQGRLKAPSLPLSQDHLPLGHLPLPAGLGERERLHGYKLRTCSSGRKEWGAWRTRAFAHPAPTPPAGDSISNSPGYHPSFSPALSAGSWEAGGAEETARDHVARACLEPGPHRKQSPVTQEWLLLVQLGHVDPDMPGRGLCRKTSSPKFPLCWGEAELRFPSLIPRGSSSAWTPGLRPTLTHLLLHQLELLLEPGVVPLLLQADPLGLVPAAHGVVLLHLLHLLLLLTLQVLQLRVKELLLGLQGAERRVQQSHFISRWEEDGEQDGKRPKLVLRPGLKSQLRHRFTV